MPLIAVRPGVIEEFAYQIEPRVGPYAADHADALRLCHRLSPQAFRRPCGAARSGCLTQNTA